MIEVRALIDEAGGRTQITVDGHGRTSPDDALGPVACASVSIHTQTSIAFLHALAEQFPDHIRFILEETHPCPS